MSKKWQHTKPRDNNADNQNYQHKTHKLTLIDMGIMMEHSSSNRRGITNSSYHGPSSGYKTYHCYKKNKKRKLGI